VHTWCCRWRPSQAAKSPRYHPPLLERNGMCLRVWRGVEGREERVRVDGGLNARAQVDAMYYAGHYPSPVTLPKPPPTLLCKSWLPFNEVAWNIPLWVRVVYVSLRVILALQAAGQHHKHMHARTRAAWHPWLAVLPACTSHASAVPAPHMPPHIAHIHGPASHTRPRSGRSAFCCCWRSRRRAGVRTQ
jgi:hypothetical protein